ncbi:putative Metallothionein, family 15, plant [Helianthus annuus]|uniref:Metallothionein-like protein n=1 Tax=Helianthus annuus TaxID=4232 RepID=A0A251VML4_HELAN|nr:putative Metallothionein, family 15, plant [Helianthus annuus]KAJ0611196.1 putative Metallothionein, family 15, plant [Helianthus annuus]KAJ0622166.1 putative Metallothionein, family 15, plant [Helianthus annuus]KAJ0626475.1 putative Metallothionein, family 15, plant [Helianthus annuus]KAJ0782810.1 putative Metallothionein, family 15, plant [Helianthus annuus]
MSCSSGKCNCGSSCSCGSSCNCNSCNVEMSTTTTTIIVDGVAPRMTFAEETEVAESGNACKCGSNCKCDPCNC